MEWKLDSIFRRNKINQTALSEVLVEKGWTMNKVRGVTKQINEHCHDFLSFVRRQDMLEWYMMYRSYLNVSSMELTGCKTDQEAVEALLKAKLQRHLNEQGFNVTIKDLTIEEAIPEIQSVDAEVLNRYIGKPMRKRV